MLFCFSPQGEYSGFIYSYAVEEPLSVVHKVAGYLPSLFWGFITLGRLISIPVSYRMKPATMVFINVVMLFLPSSCLLSSFDAIPGVALHQAVWQAHHQGELHHRLYVIVTDMQEAANTCSVVVVLFWARVFWKQLVNHLPTSFIFTSSSLASTGESMPVSAVGKGRQLAWKFSA